MSMRAKQYCDQLFELERGFADLSAEKRRLMRQEQSEPLMREFFHWLKAQNASTKSAFGNAVHYVFEQKKYLVNYLLDGRLEMSNNRAERSIKPFVIGRKNFLFANTARGAKASAVMYSLVETAKENGLNPYDYLAWVLKTAPKMTLIQNPKLAEQLLPGRFRDLGKGV
jgi:transposase